MRSYQARKWAVPTFIAIYVVVAVIGGMRSPRGEYFPVFNWSLFSYIAESRTLPEIYVTRIGDKSFVPAKPYSDLGEYFETARNRSTNVRKLLI